MSKFYYFGPLLYHVKVKEEDLSNIKKLCEKDPDKLKVKDLAGHIDDEFVVDQFKLSNILKDYFPGFEKTWKHFYGTDIPKFEIADAWVNFMKAGDFNPPHIHTNDLSSVIFLNIPDELKKENLEHYNKGIKSRGPGALVFYDGLPRHYFNNMIEFSPQTGDMFIFPASLPHWVFPFKSNIERISLAFNIDFKK